jgi:hypothetical protein
MRKLGSEMGLSIDFSKHTPLNSQYSQVTIKPN